jgi:hypothetical protein
MAERMFETKNGSVDLRRLLLHHQETLLAKLGAGGLFDHPTAKGDIGEGAWRDLLEKFLPNRYQVSKAFVLDAHGETSEQIDVVIHDRHFCPLLFEQDDQCYIPAESVFAVFEVRPALDRGVIEYAANKARSVRRLYRTSREMIDRGEVQPPREPFNIIAGVLAVKSDWSPPFGDRLIDALSASDEEGRLQLGCAPADGAFEAIYDEAGRPELEVSEDGGALLFFLMRLFHHLQMIGSPMAIDLREYTRTLEDPQLDPAEATS